MKLAQKIVRRMDAMKLAQKLLLSHVGVAVLGMIILGAVALPIASNRFVMEQEQIEVYSSGTSTQLIEQEVETTTTTNFQTALLTGLIVAGIVAVIGAGGISWFLSRRMLRPIQNIAAASQTIAAGHYDLTIPVQQQDELGELAAHFNTMATALHTIETSRKQLLADVSHELKTPLASIKGYMEGLQEGVIEPAPATFRLIYQEAVRLQRLVHDLEIVSQAEAGITDLHPVPLKITDLITGVRDHLAMQFESKGVALNILHSPALLCADRDRLTQVLMNVMGNALQYTPSGGTVKIEVGEAADEMHITISDTGIGIAAEHLPHIFQRFYRVDRSRARTSGGSGIGLTIARQYVEAHGGRIEVESGGVNQGSCFYITLPKFREN